MAYGNLLEKDACLRGKMAKGSQPRSRHSNRNAKGNTRGRTDDTLALTARQKEILRLVAQGLTNREIGEHLGISVRTVEVHRFNLMRRLRVRNVAQLLRQALLMKLISKQSVTK
ncbi:MAG: DNA-binding response regulator [Nitrospirae bacterium]|nr:MAG: DNA-binding response regulator [Nitrospirota bacterium]